MVIGSTALVSEANGGANRVVASVLDVADTDTARVVVDCSIAEINGTAVQNCTDKTASGGIGCPAGTYTVKVNGPSESSGSIGCGPNSANIAPIAECTVASPCQSSMTFAGDPTKSVFCSVTKVTPSGRPAARATCTVTAP